MATHSSVLAWRIPGTGSLVGCRLWGRTELDTTEVTQHSIAFYCTRSQLWHAGYLVEACGIQFPDKGQNPSPLHWESRVLVIGPPGSITSYYFGDIPGGSDSKESVCNAEDLGLIPGSRRSSGGGNGNPLQYSCLENSMDRAPRGLQSTGLQRVRHD